ncbi:MAG: HAD-IA family hydrolase [Ruminococcus sp.]|nr:HAD-IA family hydrolase [Ruminococcus sp.]
MSRYRVLLFDLDGTLTDSAPGIVNCARYALAEMGLPEPEDLMCFVGPPLYVSFPKFCGLDEAQTKEAIRLYRERYATIGLFENGVYPGIPEMLMRLKNSGKRLFAATSKPEKFARQIMDRYGLSQFFEFIGGAALDGSRDDKNDVIDYVLETAGITDRSQVIMIGDREQDVLGAEKCGIPCMGVLWGYGSREELSASSLLAETPSEAADILLGKE